MAQSARHRARMAMTLMVDCRQMGLQFAACDGSPFLCRMVLHCFQGKETFWFVTQIFARIIGSVSKWSRGPHPSGPGAELTKSLS